jgi:hypothetical protein
MQNELPMATATGGLLKKETRAGPESGIYLFAIVIALRVVVRRGVVVVTEQVLSKKKENRIKKA